MLKARFTKMPGSLIPAGLKVNDFPIYVNYLIPIGYPVQKFWYSGF